MSYTFSEASHIARRNIDSAVNIMADSKKKRLATVCEMNKAMKAATFMLQLAAESLNHMQFEYGRLEGELIAQCQTLQACQRGQRC